MRNGLSSERAKRVEGFAPSGADFTRRSRTTAEDAENGSPGRMLRTGADLLSIHYIKVFDGPVERSLHHTEQIRPCQ